MGMMMLNPAEGERLLFRECLSPLTGEIFRVLIDRDYLGVMLE
jgi:hypothetical protein